jgi:Ca-activated chloride channel homolog
MIDKSNQNVILKIIGLAVSVFILFYIVDAIIGGGGPDPNLPQDEQLKAMIGEIDVKTVPHQMGTVDILPPDLNKILPDISKYSPQVNSSTPNYIEIFSSTEKAGSGTDGWLTEVARDFNNANIMIDGKPVSVRLRGIASGQGADYITSGKYLPDAFTPSNEHWGEIINSEGLKRNWWKRDLLAMWPESFLLNPRKTSWQPNTGKSISRRLWMPSRTKN